MVYRITVRYARLWFLLTIAGLLVAGCTKTPTLTEPVGTPSGVRPSASAAQGENQGEDSFGPEVVQNTPTQDSTAVTGRGVLIGSGH